MKKILLNVLVIGFLASCDPITYHNIPDDERPLLENNDTIYYIDKANNLIDTFCIRLSYSYHDPDYTNRVEYVTMSYSKYNNSTNFEGFYILQSIGSADIDNIGKYYFSSGIRLDENNEDKTVLNMNIGDVLYPIVYKFTDLSTHEFIPNTVYFTFNHGIIRYDYADGRKYELMNNIDK